MPLLCAGAAFMPIDAWSVVLLLRLPLFLLLLSLLLLFFVLSAPSLGFDISVHDAQAMQMCQR